MPPLCSTKSAILNIADIGYNVVTGTDAASDSEPAKPEEAGSAAREEAKKDAVGSMPPEAKPREHAEGMSATSGPLQDEPEFAHAAQ